MHRLSPLRPAHGLSYSIQSDLQHALNALFVRDSQSEEPIIQSISLFFWQFLEQWIHQTAVKKEPFIIALTGASGSGKSFIREALIEKLASVIAVSSFTQDNYYRDFEADFPHLPLERFYDEINLDDPAHIRFKKLGEDLNRLKRLRYGQTLTIPKLIFGTPTSKPTIVEQGIDVEVTPFVVTEGIHSFCDPSILHHYSLKIFVDVDENARRARWLDRNQKENRGITDNMWNTTVDCLENYILPARSAADLVINNNAQQEAVVALLHELVDILTEAFETKVSEAQAHQLIREIA